MRGKCVRHPPARVGKVLLVVGSWGRSDTAGVGQHSLLVPESIQCSTSSAALRL